MVYEAQFHLQPPKHGKPAQFDGMDTHVFQDFHMI